MFGANSENTPNRAIFKKAKELYRSYASADPSLVYSIGQTKQGEVTLRHKEQTRKHSEISEKTCLSSKEVIEKAIDFLILAKISPQKCTFYIVTHGDHTWPAMIMKKLKLDAKQKNATFQYAGSNEPQGRCRSQALFLIYRTLVLLHHKLKGWI